MAKPITATPVVTGSAAENIWKEMKEGTPSNPVREEAFRRAEGAIRNLRESPFQNFPRD